MAADEIRWGIEYQGENQKNNGLAGSRLTDSGIDHHNPSADTSVLAAFIPLQNSRLSQVLGQYEDAKRQKGDKHRKTDPWKRGLLV